MIPFVEHPSWQLGPLTIHAFGVAVAAAMWLGLSIGQRRFERTGLDVVIGNRLGGWIIAGGVLGAHLFSVLFYFPHQLREDPWLLVRVWENISSVGGMLGGVAAALLFFSIMAPATGWQTKLRYFDVVAFVFAPALAVGRAGCALAHDHPGRVTDFPLAISLQSSAARDLLSSVYHSAGLPFPAGAAGKGFHDLGLYELLFLGLFVVPAFVWWSRRSRPNGFYLVAFAALYFPARFGLDMLRVADARYLGLTPAQWTAAIALVVLPIAAMRHRRVRFALAGAVILGTAWACWNGS